jgi:hypothetical protein
MAPAENPKAMVMNSVLKRLELKPMRPPIPVVSPAKKVRVRASWL